LIEIGDDLPANLETGGAIEIARGPKAVLKQRLQTLARNGRGLGEGMLLVPGVPEAEGQRAKADALAIWLAWCGNSKGNGAVVFNGERA
jgi:hypothetical protein